MKTTLPILLLALAFCTGCINHYRVTLSNGSYYTATGKPHFDKKTNHYKFTDAVSGKQMEVSKLSIREIAPQSEVDSEKSSFQPKTGH